MFANNKSTTAANVAEAVTTGVPDAQLEQLRAIAREHQVCYEVWFERSVAEGHQILIGYELRLCGTNSHLAAKGKQAVPGCKFCQSTYEDLKGIAEWILPREERPSVYEIGGFDRALHIAPPCRHSRSEVVVHIRIMHRTDFNREIDECENLCLKEMKNRLKQLGIYEDYWRLDAQKPKLNFPVTLH